MGWALVNDLWELIVHNLFFLGFISLSLPFSILLLLFFTIIICIIIFYFTSFITIIISTHQFYLFFSDSPPPHTVSRVSSCLLEPKISCVNRKGEEACFSSAPQPLAEELCPHNLLWPCCCHNLNEFLVLSSTAHGELLNDMAQ